MGRDAPAGLAGIHVNMPLCLPDPNHATNDPDDVTMLQNLAQYGRWESGYAVQQATRPQTVGYALADSPIGQAAWIYEKFKAWTDCVDTPESILSWDQLLDNIMIYWLSNSAASSARLYWESLYNGFGGFEVNVPAGCSVFPKEIYKPTRKLVERYYKDLVYWNEPKAGGHFAAFEQPQAFVDELRACFKLMR